MPDSVWCIVPVLAGPELTEACLADLLAQSVPTRILVVNQGVDDAFRVRLEAIAEEYPDRVFVWSHVPALPSLSATWNRALTFCWQTGAAEALVVNNDVRVHRGTVECLVRVLKGEGLFVTAVGVTADQFPGKEEQYDPYMWASAFHDGPMYAKGGPHFSCFLISKTGHEKYPFDEGFIPAYCDDLDIHRRYLLGGDGDKIFSINIPFLHVGEGSQTLKSMTPEKRAALERRIDQGSRTYYREKWGGAVNAERYTIPFDPKSAQDNMTTPDLQKAAQCTS